LHKPAFFVKFKEMRKRFNDFLLTALDPKKRDLTELKALYEIATGQPAGKCKSDTCISKMINEVRKYDHLHHIKNDAAEPRKYQLKPGNHAFIGGGPAEHNNDNTSDADIERLLPIFPHIKHLLID